MEIGLLIMGRNCSGKTVAVCNAYHQLTKTGFNGEKIKFGLAVQGDTAGRDEENLKEMYIRMLKRGKLPADNTENISYEFVFQRNRETICNIYWVDHRGSLTDDRNDLTWKKDWEAFDMCLNDMVLLVYIISGEILDTYIRTKDVTLSDEERELLELDVENEINWMKVLLNVAKENWKKEMGKDDTRPVLFYVTKSDLIKYNDSRKLKELISMLGEYGLLRGNRKILGCHSTLGRNLILSEDNRILEGFQPEGFEIPLMLNVGYALSEQGKKWERDETARLDAMIDTRKINRDMLIENMAIESTKLPYRLFQKKREEIHATYKAQIENEDYQIRKLEREKDELKSNNLRKQYSQEILDYIKNRGDFVIYANEKGEVRPLEEFFK